MSWRAQRLQEVRGFGIDRVAQAADRVPRGRQWPVLRMENLDTDLALPPGVVRATTAGLHTTSANSWLPFHGDAGLRVAIADHLERRTGVRYDPEREIVVTCGGTAGVLLVLLATVDPGHEVILTDPTYAGLVNRVRLVGGLTRFVRFRASGQGWRLERDSLASVASGATRAMLMMSPSMPSGAVLDYDDWDEVSRICREHDLLLINDTAMEALLFDDRPLVHPLQFDGMRERTVLVGSLSKEHRMIGWRVGWVAGPAEVIADVVWTHTYSNTTAVGIARAGAIAALRGDQGHVAEAVAELQRRRDAILAALPDWRLVPPAGGWSMLIDVGDSGLTPERVSRLLLDECFVAATPMTGWGGEVAGRYVRLVYSCEPVERLLTLANRVSGTQVNTALSR